MACAASRKEAAMWYPKSTSAENAFSGGLRPLRIALSPRETLSCFYGGASADRDADRTLGLGGSRGIHRALAGPRGGARASKLRPIPDRAVRPSGLAPPGPSVRSTRRERLRLRARGQGAGSRRLGRLSPDRPLQERLLRP